MSSAFNTTADWGARGFRLESPPLLIAAFDPAGGGDDNDALVILSREEHQKGRPEDPDFAVATKFRVLAAKRLAAGLEFPDKLAQLLSLAKELRRRELGKRIAHFVFAVETNGVGWAMGSSLAEALGGRRVVQYTTVSKVSDDRSSEKRFIMPRLAALDHVRALIETHHLRIATGAEGADALRQELRAFVWRRKGRPEAMAGQHDDLVMALTGGVWVGSKLIPPMLKSRRFGGRT